MSSQVVSTDNATIVIQINPKVVQDRAGEQENRGQYRNTSLRAFLKIQPKALGTVQTIIAVMIFLFGIVLSVSEMPGITVFSGITFWGSLIYISAGSLSIVAENKLQTGLVKASLGMNVISAITAGIAITLMSIHLALTFSHCKYMHDYEYNRSCFKEKVPFQGIVGILLVFSILQFIVSICISAFACKATCDTDSSIVNISLNQSKVTEEEITQLNQPQLPNRN